MYKARIRSHLDYCDIIYHIASHQNQAHMGVTLNSLMEKLIESSIKQPLPFVALGVVQVVQNSARN